MFIKPRWQLAVAVLLAAGSASAQTAAMTNFPPRLIHESDAPLSKVAAANPEDRARLEADVWSAVLDRLADSRTYQQAVIRDELGGPRLGKQGRAFLAKAPEIQLDAADDYDRVNEKPSPAPTTLTWRAPVVVLSAPEADGFFASGHRGHRDGGARMHGWERFRAAHPQALAIASLSHVGFNRDFSQAIVYTGIQSDWLAGQGGLLILNRTSKGWVVIDSVPLWVS